MDYESARWNQADDYPFLKPFTCGVTTHTEESVFVIAGWSSTRIEIRRSNTIARFKDNSWAKIGSLKQARHNHSAITVEEITVIFGGSPGDGNFQNTLVIINNDL